MQSPFDFLPKSTNDANVVLNVQHCATIVDAQIIRNENLSNTAKLEFANLLRKMSYGTAVDASELEKLVPQAAFDAVQRSFDAYIGKVLNAKISDTEKSEFTNLLIGMFDGFKKTYSSENSNPYKTFEDFTPPHLVKIVRDAGLLNETKEATRQNFIDFTPPEVLAKLDSYGIKY